MISTFAFGSVVPVIVGFFTFVRLSPNVPESLAATASSAPVGSAGAVVSSLAESVP